MGFFKKIFSKKAPKDPDCRTCNLAVERGNGEWSCMSNLLPCSRSEVGRKGVKPNED